MPTLSPVLCKKPRTRGIKQLKPNHKSREYHNLYDWGWRKYSKKYRKEHPLCECEECKQRVVALPSDVVDHIIPHKGDKTLFWDENNHQAMAKTCHDKKTASEDGGFGKVEIDETGKITR